MNTTELRSFAEKATPGPWVADIEWRSYEDNEEGYLKSNSLWIRVEDENTHETIADLECCEWYHDRLQEKVKADQEANASFIAAANPTDILQLLDRLEELEDMTDTIHIPDAITNCPFCGTSVFEEFQFCGGCGARLMQMGSRIQNKNLYPVEDDVIKTLPRITLEYGDLVGMHREEEE
jgi:hypothetical protein